MKYKRPLLGLVWAGLVIGAAAHTSAGPREIIFEDAELAKHDSAPNAMSTK